MKRFMLVACATLFAIETASTSFAADLPKPSYKAPVYVAPQFSWTGFYAGINGGYGWGKSNWSNTGLGVSTGDFNTKGAIAGGTLGYNRQTGSWVWGIEADLDYSWIKGSTNTNCGSPCETDNNWLATARGRLGYARDRWLPYLTGGAAYGNIKVPSTPPFLSSDKSKFGWTAGAGVEYAFLGAWSVKLEYLYVDLGKVSCAATSCGLPADVSFNANIVRAGLNYRF